MKYFRSISFVLAITLLAGVAHAKAPWGILQEAAEDTTFSIYAIDNLIDNRPIRYAIGPGVTQQEEEIFKDNIQKWPRETLAFIKKSGREKEFQDITLILTRKIVLHKVSLEDAPDIVLYLSDELDYGDGDFRGKDEDHPFSEIRIDESYRADFASTSLHEIGHYFGLGDQYDSVRDNSHPEYSSDVSKECGSIMNESDVITEDDADGFINLIDLRLAQRNGGRFFKRARNSWKSLCPKSQNIYQNARTINRQPVDSWVGTRGDAALAFQRTYRKGKFQQHTTVVMEISPLTVFSGISDANKVIRDPKTNLIKSVYAEITQTVTLANGQTVDKVIPYERHFTYGTPTFQENEKVVSISVREVINGQEIRRQDFSLISDGRLYKGSHAICDLSGCTAKIKYVTVRTFTDYQGSFRYHVYSNEEKVDLWGTFGEDTATSIGDGQVETIPIPPDKESKFYNALACAHFFLDDLSSALNNFYEPLFGPKQTEVRQQVQDSIRSRR